MTRGRSDETSTAPRSSCPVCFVMVVRAATVGGCVTHAGHRVRRHETGLRAMRSGLFGDAGAVELVDDIEASR